MTELEPTLQEQVATLTEELAKVRQLVLDKDEELKRLRGQVDTIEADTEARLSTTWESKRLRLEVDMLRKQELLRSEHQTALDREIERSSQWVSDLKEGFRWEKRVLEERISESEIGKADEVSRTVPPAELTPPVEVPTSEPPVTSSGEGTPPRDSVRELGAVASGTASG